MFNKFLLRGVAAAALIAALGGAAVPADYSGPTGADTSYSDTQSADPPSRVGRLSFTEGTVSFHAANQNQWSPATLNFPITTGDSFWTEPGARAEIEIGAAEVRLDHATEIDVARLDDSGTQIQVEQGIINVSFASQPEAGFAVLTPRGTVIFTQPGRYRIDAGQMNGDQPSDQVLVTVLQGEARFDAANGSHAVAVGQTLTASDDPVNFTVGQALQVTAFDQWAQSRDPQPVADAGSPAAGQSITWNTPAPAASPSLQYVSPDTTGYQDLDTYGSWSTTADYGAVWYPGSVPADWAPYRYGHWAYVAPWGWTWIDDAPWGFAPFHYGRWAFVDGRWGWCPGEFDRHPVYAPALVAFIGGDDFSIGISIGSGLRHVGWVPLAPHEAFHPYYHASPSYVRNVNITTVNTTVINNITNVTNASDGAATAARFRNARGATVVREAAFTGAAPIERAQIAVSSNELAKARVENRIDFRPSAAARAGIAMPAAAEAAPAATGAPAQRSAEPTVPAAPGPAFNRDAAHARGAARIVAAPAASADAKTSPADSRASLGAPGPAINHRGNGPGRANDNAGATPGLAQPDRANAAANPASTAPAITRRSGNFRAANGGDSIRASGNSAPANGSPAAPPPAVVQRATDAGTANNGPGRNRNAQGATQLNAPTSAPGPAIVRRDAGSRTVNSPAVHSGAANAARIQPAAGASPASPGPAIGQQTAAPRSIDRPATVSRANRAAPVTAQRTAPPGPAIVQHTAAPHSIDRPATVSRVNRVPPVTAQRTTPPGPAIVQQTPARVMPSVTAPVRETAQPARGTPQIRQADMPQGGPAANPAQNAAGRANIEQQAHRNGRPANDQRQQNAD